MKATNISSDFSLLIGSLKNAIFGFVLLFNTSWTLSQLFASRIFDIAYPLASYMGGAYLALALFQFLSFQAKEVNSFFRKRDALLTQSIFFAFHAFVDLRCYSPLVGSSLSLVVGEGKIFLYLAFLDIVLSIWSFTNYNALVVPKLKPNPIASQ